MFCFDSEIKNHSEHPTTVDVTDIQPVFTKCFVAGIKLNQDLLAPHTEELTVAMIETDVESGHSECWNAVVNTIRKQVRNQVNHVFETGVKYRDDITDPALQNDGSTVHFPDLLGDVAHVHDDDKAVAVAPLLDF
jgi:hypothetical protein